jgi:hypothetical protein
LLLLGRYDESAVASANALNMADEANTYFNISHAKWLSGNPDAVAHYRDGMEKYGQQGQPLLLPEDILSDFKDFVVRGYCTPEQVDALFTALGFPTRMPKA